ncbi:hypothetical protein EJ08DRAFT_462624 [Tothia fuscella]|uniref:Uncharacterized protein n=1 Tax=Tothia fuscella TaxID=1048955 RepID=A0A9P4TUV7_9PEZI|nr:hypothetical protein EJ08DRAFT_462624 [Tothia fuscella]
MAPCGFIRLTGVWRLGIVGSGNDSFVDLGVLALHLWIHLAVENDVVDWRSGSCKTNIVLQVGDLLLMLLALSAGCVAIEIAFLLQRLDCGIVVLMGLQIMLARVRICLTRLAWWSCCSRCWLSIRSTSRSVKRCLCGGYSVSTMTQMCLHLAPPLFSLTGSDTEGTRER